MKLIKFAKCKIFIILSDTIWNGQVDNPIQCGAARGFYLIPSLFSLSRQTRPFHLFSSSSISCSSCTIPHSQGFCFIHPLVWITVGIAALNGVSLRSQDTVTVMFRSCFPRWGCALCVCRVGRFLSDGLHPKLSSTGSSPLLVMCGATGSSCGRSCLTERDLTGTWLIKTYVFYLPVAHF